MKQIIALGGGGFSMEPDHPLLDLYILAQSKKAKPKVCFVATASGDSDSYIARFYEAFRQHPCEPTHLSLFHPPTRHLEQFILDQDIIYVGGGNTKNLLALWKEWKLEPIFQKALNQGVILAGVSAGAICWFEQGVTDSYGDGLEPISALGFIPGSFCPHYDGEEARRPSYQQLIETDVLRAGIAADDGVALHYRDNVLHKVVSSRPEAAAFKVYKDVHLTETKISSHYLKQHVAENK